MPRGALGMFGVTSKCLRDSFGELSGWPEELRGGCANVSSHIIQLGLCCFTILQELKHLGV